MASSALVLALQSNSMERKRRVAVVGAGLGGLSIAGFLQRAGFPVTVYERAPTFSRIGAGIILSANITKALRRLDVEDALVAAGIKPHCYISRMGYRRNDVQDRLRCRKRKTLRRTISEHPSRRPSCRARTRC